MDSRTFYDNDGRIISTVRGLLSIADFSALAHLNQINEYADYNTDWVCNGEITPREVNPAIFDGLYIKNVPCPGKLFINNKEYSITDSEIELGLPPGAYMLVLDCFPYLPKTFEVTI